MAGLPQEAPEVHFQVPGPERDVRLGHLQVRHSRRGRFPSQRRLRQAEDPGGGRHTSPILPAAPPRDREPTLRPGVRRQQGRQALQVVDLLREEEVHGQVSVRPRRHLNEESHRYEAAFVVFSF